MTAAVMIGIDPHKASHTAVVISGAEEPLGELRVRSGAAQAERLLEWAAAWPERTWAVEGAGGLGHLLDWQLLSAGERVLDVQPRLGRAGPAECARKSAERPGRGGSSRGQSADGVVEVGAPSGPGRGQDAGG